MRLRGRVHLVLMNLRWASLGFLVCGLLLRAAAQETPTFSSHANVVLVPTLVRDADGHAVYGLQAKDFIVEDDGVEQKINLDETADAEPVSVMVVVQTGRSAKREFPRIIGLSSLLDPILSAPQNRMALVEFDDQVNLVRDFTNDASLIDSDLKNLEPGDDGAAIFDAVRYSANLLNKLPDAGQRVLLLISETRDHGSHWGYLDEVVKLIGDSNTAVYALVFSPSLSNLLDAGRGKEPDYSQPSGLLAPMIMAMEAMRKNAPKAISSMTGGEYELFESRKGFENYMNEFSNHLHSRYLLSFEPKDPHPELHQLRVRLRDNAKADVLSRGSYWAGGVAPKPLPGTD